MTAITRREWVWTTAVAALVVIASTVPYVAGYLAQTTEARFGGALLDQVDYHSHLAKMWQGYRGCWRYRLLFTPEEHHGVYLQTPYLALGHLARLTGLSLPLVYQLARVVFALLVLLAIYRFIALFVGPARTRRAAFLLTTTASGLGWLTEVFVPTPPGGISPMEFWLLDGFTYLAVLTSPHFCAAIGLLLVVFILHLRRPGGPSVGEGVLAVLASLALGLIHPYLLLVADLLPALYWAIRTVQTRRVAWRGLAATAAMALGQLPLLAYELWVFRTQPVFAGWAAQNVTLSPPLPVYLWGYGSLLMLGAIGIVVWARRGTERPAFPLLWIGLVAVLVYLPWNLQRRFLEGVQVPLGMLAGVGLAEGLLPRRGERRNVRWRWLALSLVIALAAMSNLYLTAGSTLAATTRAPALFWSADLLAGIDWLGENTSWEETVLAGPETGGLIAARIGHRVVVGHWMETVDYAAKQAAVARFFSADTPDAERTALLQEWGVAYVVHGPVERPLGAFEPERMRGLERVFDRGQVVVYEVQR